MQLARRSTIVALVAIVAIGCRAAPTPAASRPVATTDDRRPASPASVQWATLTYLRTNCVDFMLGDARSVSEYYDYFELRNQTAEPIRYLTFFHVSPAVNVRSGTGTWIATTRRWALGSWPFTKVLGPGQTVEMCSESWLRPSQASVAVGRLGDGDAAQWPGEFARAEYDSSLAFPDVTPPPLGQRAIEMLPPVPPELQAPALGPDAPLYGDSDR